jgi:hypothetical protein
MTVAADTRAALAVIKSGRFQTGIAERIRHVIWQIAHPFTSSGIAESFWARELDCIPAA